MKKWNDYYDSMDPRKKNPYQNEPIDVSRAPSVKYFSEYPRREASEQSNAASRNTPIGNAMQMQIRKPNGNNSITVERIHQGERYISRPTEFGTVSNRVDDGHTNFAWVD